MFGINHLLIARVYDGMRKYFRQAVAKIGMKKSVIGIGYFMAQAVYH